MLGIAAAHLLGDGGPTPFPEAGQIVGCLDWTAGGRGEAEDEGDLAVGDGGVLGEAEQSLDPGRDGRPGLRIIIDRVATPRRRRERVGRQPVHRLSVSPAELRGDVAGKRSRVGLAQVPYTTSQQRPHYVVAGAGGALWGVGWPMT